MEVSGRRPACSEDWDTGIPCDPCTIDNVYENAQFYCTNCDEFLCDICARNHRKSKALRQHQLLDREEMPGKKISNVQDMFCAKHDGKLMEYFCNKHDTLCCSVCVTLYHGQCGVKYIDDLAKGFSSSQEYKLLLKQIRDIEKQLGEDKSKRQNQSTDVTNCFRQLKADIQVFRSEINSKIDALEYELMEQAEQIHSEDLKAIESVDTLYDKLLVDMSEMSSTLGLLEQCKQNQELFILAKKARTQVKEYNDNTRNMLQENIVRRYAFSRNEYILNTLNSPSKVGSLEMKNEVERRTTKREKTEVGLMTEDNPTIDKLCFRRKEEQQEEYATQHEEKTMMTDTFTPTLPKREQIEVELMKGDNPTIKPTLPKRDFKPTKVKLLKITKMNHVKDTKVVSIIGSVFMSGDHLGVADRNNMSIKVIDLRSETITCYIKLDGKPRDITSMDPGTLVVTCYTYLMFLHYERKSGFLRSNGKLSVVKKVPMESGCKGITYRNGKLFVTFNGVYPSVKILNHEGKVLRTFKHNDQEQNLFIRPENITVNSEGDTIYVSDFKQNTVTSLSMDGKVCNRYKNEQLKFPKCLTLGDDDSIYVVGRGSHNIHHISPNCTPVSIVLEEKDGLISPQTVLYNNTEQTLYVSSDSISGDLLHVYKLE